MANSRAIPQGYMTVGELAKKVGTTVRTLQYYDREGLLAPSAESEGGRRLYTDQDAVKLHQILSLKYLGFSLDEIKNRLTSLDTPADMAAALTEHATAIREKMAALSEALQAIETLKAEVLQMQSVNFQKYADIIVNLQMKNEMYWVIKHFDDATLDHIRSRFDKESGLALIELYQRLCEQAIAYQTDGTAPESEKGQRLAEEFWGMILQFTGGDLRLLPKLYAFADNAHDERNAWAQKQTSANAYLELALGAYFDALGYNPLEEGTH